MSHRIPKNRYVVLCKTEGEYVLATRRLFTSYEEANEYCKPILFRNPVIVPSEAFLRLVDGWYEEPPTESTTTVSGEIFIQ